MTAWLLPDRGRRRAFRTKALAALALLAVIGLPAILVALGAGGSGGGGGVVGTPRPTSIVFLPYTFFVFVAGFTVGPTVAELHDLPPAGAVLRQYPEVLVYLAVFGPLFLIGTWTLRRRGDRAAVLLPWAFGVPILVFASAALSGQTYNVRYSYPAVPGVALVLALAVDSLGRWRVPAVALVAALFGFSLANYYLNPAYDKEHFRDAMTFVRAGGDADDPVAVVGQGWVAAEHYAPGFSVGRLRGCRNDAAEADPGAAIYRPEDLRDEPDVWLVVSRDWDRQALDCQRILAATHQVVDEREFVGVEVYRLRRR